MDEATTLPIRHTILRPGERVPPPRKADIRFDIEWPCRCANGEVLHMVIYIPVEAYQAGGDALVIDSMARLWRRAKAAMEEHEDGGR